MEKVKNIRKGGWHPPSTSKEFKDRASNRVAGLRGKGKDPLSTAQEHQSRPLASLKDPSAFGPPPKNLAYHGGAASPHATAVADRSTLGATSSAEQIRAVDKEYQQQIPDAEEAEQQPKPPVVPYSADTTGLPTAHLPAPPLQRTGHEDQSYPKPTSSGRKAKPSLPPRLPPRRATALIEIPTSPPPAYNATHDEPAGQSYVNQSSVNRLGSAGISVPGFGIGGASEVSNPCPDKQPSSSSAARGAELGGLKSRFSRLSTGSSASESPTEGTSFSQKQAALKTANSFRNDPSSISLSNAKATASTANNFRERHGDQVAAGWKGANALNKKYDMTKNVNGYDSNGVVSSRTEARFTPASPNTINPPLLPVKKRAPPPPPKRPMTESSSAPSPPPIPFLSKPKP